MVSLLDYNINSLKNIINNTNNLKDLTINGDKLYYNDQAIDLNKINLYQIIKPYSKLAMDISLNNIDSKSFFEVLQTKSFKIEELPTNNSNQLANYALYMLNNDKPKDYDIINYYHFYELSKRYPNLSEDETNDFNNFLSYVSLLMIQDKPDESYLDDKEKQTLTMYHNIMQNVQEKDPSNPLLNNYYKMIDDSKKENKKRNDKVLLLEKKAGYINALIVLPFIIVTGIAIGAVIFFFK